MEKHDKEYNISSREIAKQIIKGFTLVEIMKNGDIKFQQGLNGMEGTLSGNAIKYYLNRFSWIDRKIIEKHLEKKINITI